jgi:hypothetical protein
MAMKTKERVEEMRPYVERALKDEDLRDNLRAAYDAARSVYADLLGDRGVTGIAARVATDKEIQDNLKTAIEEIRTAADRVQGKKEHTTRNTMLLLTGLTLGILYNPATGPQTRQWLKDKILGPEDDFTYGGSTGTTQPTTTSETTPTTSS